MDGTSLARSVGRFANRKEAGERLSTAVAERVRGGDVVVLGLPRGGVPVAHEVATALGAPLDVITVRKVGVPWQPELALGAVATGGVTIFNDAVIAEIDLKEGTVGELVERERSELERREALYRQGRPPLEVDGRTVVVVDDGIATGASIRAAVEAVRRRGAAVRVVAVPVAPPETVRALEAEADQVICLQAPPHLMAVGAWYDDFTPVSDQEVIRLLRLPRDAR
ncbi:MAG: phosphoribosyltransferase family protein [Gemmatimonadota bacterium]|nr:phosphoribosyltransferase family protein [Gemmatimonadota bacterium]MDH5759038.1 phosphoribosyltransferase family protein [Gemmatimonadota bacterium]